MVNRERTPTKRTTFVGECSRASNPTCYFVWSYRHVSAIRSTVLPAALLPIHRTGTFRRSGDGGQLQLLQRNWQNRPWAALRLLRSAQHVVRDAVDDRVQHAGPVAFQQLSSATRRLRHMERRRKRRFLSCHAHNCRWRLCKPKDAYRYDTSWVVPLLGTC
jgi:hypothetical protein